VIVTDGGTIVARPAAAAGGAAVATTVSLALLALTADDVAALVCVDFGAAARVVTTFDAEALFDGATALCGAAPGAVATGAGAVTSTVTPDAATGARSVAGVVAGVPTAAPAAGCGIRLGTASAATITRPTPATAMLARRVRRRPGVNARFMINERFMRVAGSAA
jgi:hypothetical protein